MRRGFYPEWARTTLFRAQGPEKQAVSGTVAEVTRSNLPRQLSAATNELPSISR